MSKKFSEIAPNSGYEFLSLENLLFQSTVAINNNNYDVIITALRSGVPENLLAEAMARIWKKSIKEAEEQIAIAKTKGNTSIQEGGIHWKRDKGVFEVMKGLFT